MTKKENKKEVKKLFNVTATYSTAINREIWADSEEEAEELFSHAKIDPKELLYGLEQDDPNYTEEGEERVFPVGTAKRLNAKELGLSKKSMDSIEEYFGKEE